MDSSFLTPGPVVLFGSGETSPSGRKVFDQLFRRYPLSPQVVVLETPAGFELNSSQVAGRIADFLKLRMQNYRPQVSLVPARKRGTPYSPDEPGLIPPILKADMIFMGPGSPTYAVRQLHDSLAWNSLVARHRLGAALVLASAAAIAVSALTLPVYEIYKAGDELHWKAGLNFFCAYGLSLVIIPHWNNNDGGEELDTSRCFMGQERFTRLIEILPSNYTVLGIDEKTALIMDLQAGSCQVNGLGGVTLVHTGSEHPGATSEDELYGTGLVEVAQLRKGHVHQYTSGETFALEKLGPFRLPDARDELPAAVWQAALQARRQEQISERAEGQHAIPASEEVQALLDERRAARARRDWAAADALRTRLAALGWQVKDTPEGPKLERAD